MAIMAMAIAVFVAGRGIVFGSARSKRIFPNEATNPGATPRPVPEALEATAEQHESLWHFRDEAWNSYYPTFPAYSDLETRDQNYSYAIKTTKNRDSIFNHRSVSCSDYVPCWEEVKEQPFNIYPSIKVKNPVLTAKDVKDVKAKYVADPFLFHENNLWYMFFEVFNKEKDRGEIGLASSPNGLDWNYEKIVLTEDVNISFPYVFKYNGNYYMIPETCLKQEIRLYKSYDFPYEWKYQKTLIKGKYFVDSSTFFYNGKWWIFTSAPDTQLYYSDTLLSSNWTEHPQSPIVKRDASKARGAGRTIILGKNRIIRLAQKNDKTYGEKVRGFEVDILTTTEYSEHEIEESPLLESGHQIDPWWTGSEWLCTVDKQALFLYKNKYPVYGGNWTISIYSSIDTPQIPQKEWKLIDKDSEETKKEDNRAINAFDGDVYTIWHTSWSGTPGLPHEIQIDLGNSYHVKWFIYFPRQDGGINGRIGKYKFYVTDSISNWGDPVAVGTFANNALEKTVCLTPKTGRYIRLEAITEVNGKPWTSMAEIKVLGTLSP